MSDTYRPAVRAQVRCLVDDANWTLGEQARTGGVQFECLVQLNQVTDEQHRAMLIELLSDADIRYRIGAAAILCADDTPAEYVTDVFLEGIAQKDARVRKLSWLFMSLASQLPDRLAAELKKYLNSRDLTVRVFAAASLRNLPEAIPVLKQAAVDDNDAVAVTAAAALAWVGHHVEQSIATLVRILHANHGLRLPIIDFLAAIGPPAADAVPSLEAILLDHSEDAFTRTRAALALGKIACAPPDPGTTHRSLAWAKRLRDWSVINAVAESCRQHGELQDNVVEALIGLLDNPDSTMRGSAAMTLGQFGTGQPAIISGLAKRLKEETDDQICGILVSSIAALGSPVISALIEILAEGTFQARALAGTALLLMGSTAAAEIAERLLTHPIRRVRFDASWLLHGLGPAARNAVPILLRLFEDDRFRMDAVRAVSAVGPDAKAAAPALAEFLVGLDHDLADWARMGLIRIGPEAIPAVEAVKESASDEALGRLTEVMERLHGILRLAVGLPKQSLASPDPKLWSAFRETALRFRNELRTFYIIGRALNSELESVNAVAKELKRREGMGLSYEGVPPNQKQLSRIVKNLENRFFSLDLVAEFLNDPGRPVRLFQRSQGVRSRLTRVGKEALKLVERWLTEEGLLPDWKDSI